MAEGRGSFVLNDESLPRKIGDFYTALINNEEIRDSFVANPTTVALRKVAPQAIASIAPAALITGNRLIYSALRNEGFRTWLSDYQKTVSERVAAPENAGKALIEVLPREQFLKDISGALIKAGDPELLATVMQPLDASIPSVAWDPVTDDIVVVTKVAALLLAIVTAIDLTPYAPPPDLAIDARQLRAIGDSLLEHALARRA